MVSLIPGATTRPEFSPFLKFYDNADFKQSKIKDEAVRSRRGKRIQGSKQEDSEGSEESKGGLNRCSVRGD